MFKALRIVCALAAAALAVACVFLGIFLGIVPFFCCVAGAVFFFALSMLFKFLQEDKEKKDEPPVPYIPDVAPPAGETTEKADAVPSADDGTTTPAPAAPEEDGGKKTDE